MTHCENCGMRRRDCHCEGPPMVEAHWVPLKEPAYVTYTDYEDGRTYRRLIKKGGLALVRGVVRDGNLFVKGIARPTIHGGGVHVQARDAETGADFSAIVDAYVMGDRRP